VTRRGWPWVTARPTFTVDGKDEMGKKKKWKEEEEEISVRIHCSMV
jgi:hypothetical protein